MRNFGYFLKEVKTIIRLNLLSNLVSILSIGLIFFLLSLILSCWWVSDRVMEVIRGEAEISLYFSENLSEAGVQNLLEKVKGIGGVREARLVTEEEAYGRMEEILGKEARVLEYFDVNPFEAFIEARIHLEEMESILNALEGIQEIEYIRDNREVLERLNDITRVLGLLGYLVASAVGISTLVIVSHIIRMGIYNSREEINTLSLLGAPFSFIAFPFLLEGLILALGGGALAAWLSVFVIKGIFARLAGPLPFIPLPPLEELASGIVILVLSLSGIMGIVGSLFGLSSAKEYR